MTTETPKNGLHTEYYDSGQKRSEVNYKDDKRDGKWTTYNRDGSFRELAKYKYDDEYSWQRKQRTDK